MLHTHFDFTIASFSTVEEIVSTEIDQADILEIRQKVDGGIYHSHELQWFGNLHSLSTVDQMIRSKKERKSLQENKQWFEEHGFVFSIVPMTIKLFDEFYALYQETTLKRERPQTFSIKEQILGKVFIEKPVFLIGMFKEKKLESGLVFSISDHQALVSFGAKKKFPDRRGGVGGVLEQLLIQYCFEHDLTEISHGRSKNPVGIFSKAGIFEFKARYGFSAFPAGYWKTTFILNPKIALSDLIFVTTIDEQVGYMVISDATEKEVQKKYLTREVRSIKHQTFADLQKSVERFKKQL